MRNRFAAVILLSAFAARSTVAPAAGRVGQAAKLAGTVVDESTRRPIAGLRVTVGAQTATTDAEGRFVLRGVSDVYDVVVADADGSSVSLYRGLRRRDPALVHKPRSGSEAEMHRGAVRGTLAGGGGPYPMTSGDAYVAFFSPESAEKVRLQNIDAKSYSGRPIQNGPAYGPIEAHWIGRSSVKGVLMALRSRPGAKDTAGTIEQINLPPAAADASFWFAKRDVTLTSAQASTADLDLEPVTSGLLTGEVRPPNGVRVTQLQAYYAFPFPGATIALPSDQRRLPRFDYPVPDLRRQGGTLCVVAFCGDTGRWIWGRRCGLAPGDPVSLPLAEPPTLSSPAAGSAIVPGMRFAWTSAAPGIYEIKLEPTWTLPSRPRIHLYTAEIETTWPDLRALGVAFPEGGAKYTITVGRLGPYATMDEATGAEGLCAQMAPAQWQSYTHPLDLTVPGAPSSVRSNLTTGPCLRTR
jgi:hypothetical protein